MFDFQVSRWLCPSGSSQMNAIAVTISHMEQWNLIARVYMAYEDAKDDCGDAATRASSLTIFRESVIEESEPKRIIPPSEPYGINRLCTAILFRVCIATVFRVYTETLYGVFHT